MTATVGAGSQETRAAPPVPATAAQPWVEEAERRRQLLQALTTEHFTLQTARSATIADSNGRSALYLATVSSAIVALAFIGQVARLGRAFHLFALALLPALVLLGVLTYLRLGADRGGGPVLRSGDQPHPPPLRGPGPGRGALVCVVRL
jgi:hypothetical protein